MLISVLHLLDTCEAQAEFQKHSEHGAQKQMTINSNWHALSAVEVNCLSHGHQGTILPQPTQASKPVACYSNISDLVVHRFGSNSVLNQRCSEGSINLISKLVSSQVLEVTIGSNMLEMFRKNTMNSYWCWCCISATTYFLQPTATAQNDLRLIFFANV